MVRKLMLNGWFMCQILDIPFYKRGSPCQTGDNASQYVHYFIPQEFHATELHGVDVSFPNTDFTV